jgi:hypothetical protein
MPPGSGPIEEITYKNPMAFNARFADEIEHNAIYQSVADEFFIPYKLMINDLIGASFENSDKDTIALVDNSPRGSDGKVRRTWWSAIYYNMDAWYLAPTGLSFQSDHSGTDSTRWSITKLYYNGKTYQSIAEFVQGYANKTVTPSKSDATYRKGDFSQLQDPTRYPERKYEKQYGPALFSSGSPRFAVNYDQKYVEWMDW